MPFDDESPTKLQIVLTLAIIIAGARAAYIVYERHEAMKEDTKPRQEAPLKADYYVTPKKLHPYDLKSARELTKQPVWVKVGGQITYYPWDRAAHRADWKHEAGTLGPLQKLDITDVVTDVAPKGSRQVMALFALDGKPFAAPIGVKSGDDFKIYSDDIFFVQDPHELYKHWSADVWKAIDARQVQRGMSELQASFAIGMGIPLGLGGYGWRALRYANDGKPVTITFENDKAVEIKAGA